MTTKSAPATPFISQDHHLLALKRKPVEHAITRAVLQHLIAFSGGYGVGLTSLFADLDQRFTRAEVKKALDWLVMTGDVQLVTENGHVKVNPTLDGSVFYDVTEVGT